jgi:hypothetical protein
MPNSEYLIPNGEFQMPNAECHSYLKFRSQNSVMLMHEERHGIWHNDTRQSDIGQNGDDREKFLQLG